MLYFEVWKAGRDSMHLVKIFRKDEKENAIALAKILDEEPGTTALYEVVKKEILYK